MYNGAMWRLWVRGNDQRGVCSEMSADALSIYEWFQKKTVHLSCIPPGACTRQIPQLTGVGFRSDRRNTNPRYTMQDSHGQRSNALAPSPAARGPPTRGMACAST